MAYYRGITILLLLSMFFTNWIYPYQERSSGRSASSSVEPSTQGLEPVSYSAAGYPWTFYERIDRGNAPSWYRLDLISIAGNLAIWGCFFGVVWWRSALYLSGADSSQPRKQFRFRCKVSDLFLAMLLVSLALGCIVRNRNEYQESQVLSSTIRNARGMSTEAYYWPSVLPNDFLLDMVFPLDRIVGVTIHNPTDALLQKIVSQPKLHSLSLSGADYSLKDLNPLRGNPHLKYLKLTGRDLDPGTLELIGDIKSLQVLDLEDTNITESQLSLLGEMPQLKHLSIGNTNVELQATELKPWMRTIKSLRLPSPSQGASTHFQLNAWPELVDLQIVESNNGEKHQAILNLVASHCPKMKSITVPDSQQMDLSLSGLPNLREILTRNGKANFAKGNGKLVRIRNARLIDLPSIENVQFDLRGFDNIQIDQCPKLDCDAIAISEPNRSISISEVEKLIAGIGNSQGITSLNLGKLPNYDVPLSPISSGRTIRRLTLPAAKLSTTQLQQLNTMDRIEEIVVAAKYDIPSLLEIWPNLRRIEAGIIPPQVRDGSNNFVFYSDQESLFVHSEPIRLQSAKSLASFFEGDFRQVDSVVLDDLPELQDLVQVSRELKLLQVRKTPKLKGLLTFSPWPEDASLEGLTELETFSAGGQKFDDEDFTGMENSLKMKCLTLGYCGVSSEKLRLLGEFKNLTALALTGSAVTDDTVQDWPNFKSMKTLMLDRTKITSASLPWICQLKSLTHLSIDSVCLASISSEQIDFLKQLSSLSLHGDGGEVALDRVSDISNSKALALIRIENAALSKETLLHLLNCLPKSLQVLDLCNCTVAEADLDVFIPLLPPRLILGVEGLEVSYEAKEILMQGFRAIIEDNSDIFLPGAGNFAVRSSVWPKRRPASIAGQNIVISSSGLPEKSINPIQDPANLVKPSRFAPR